MEVTRARAGAVTRGCVKSDEQVRGFGEEGPYEVL
jgi:hypothetical protein